MAADHEVIIREVLTREFEPITLDIIDESHKHAGHFAQSHSKGSHFFVRIVSKKFDSLSPVARHRAVYAVLKPFLGDEAIHALSMEAHSPSELKQSECANE